MENNTNPSRKLWTILFWAGMLLPFVISALFYSRLPEQVVIRWGFQGQPDGYASRTFAAWGIPAFLFVCAVVVRAAFATDPKKQNIDRQPLLKQVACWILVILSCVVQLIIMTSAVGVALPVPTIIGSLVGLLMVVVGNYLPKSLPTYTIGIRLPWTLASVQNWKSTHHFAGYLWIFGGIVFILCMVFGWGGKLIFFIPVTLVLLPALYSMLYYLLRERKD